MAIYSVLIYRRPWGSSLVIQSHFYLTRHADHLNRERLHRVES